MFIHSNYFNRMRQKVTSLWEYNNKTTGSNYDREWRDCFLAISSADVFYYDCQHIYIKMVNSLNCC